MDVLTVILLLSVGSFVFGLLLSIFQQQQDKTQRIPFWVAAKFLQGTGSLILFYRGAAPDFATVLTANSLLLLGCAYEAWAIFYIVGRPVSRRIPVAMTAAIVIANLSTAGLSLPYRSAVIFLLQSVFYLLSGWALLSGREAKSWLRSVLGLSFSLLTFLNVLCALQLFLGLGQSLPPAGGRLYQVLPVATFCMLLISGFSMLLLAMERSDRLLREADAFLKKTEVQYRRIVETAIEGILAFDHNSMLTYVNQQLAGMLGYTREEMLGRNIREFIPEDQQRDHEDQMKNRSQGQDGVYERGLCSKDGSMHWMLVSAKALMDEDSHYTGSFAMLTDINARKQLEAALQESEAKYRMFVEAAIEGVASLDSERRLTFVNRQFASMLGYSVEEMLGQPYETFMPEDQLADAEAQKQIRAQGQDAVYERCFLCKDGVRHWTLVSAKAILDAHGQFIGSFGMFTDINARKQLEAALQESEAKYRMFVEAAIEGVASLDSERRLTFVNRQFASMLGYAVEEMLGQPYETFMPEDQLADAEAQKQMRAQGRDAVYERCFLRKDGARHWTLVSAKATLDESGQFIGSFGMFTDINERKQLEHRLQQQATTDGLTGVVNRRYFLELAAREIRRALRLKQALALALIDIDYFKHINDTYGHAVGDEALLAVTRIVQQNIREIDIFGRFGGDEFVLLLPETSLGEARLVVERLCRALTAQPVDLSGKEIPMTLSVGIASLANPTDAWEALLERADRALYQAKEAGRNRVSVQSALM